MCGRIVVEPETLPKLKARPQCPEAVSKLQAWLLKKPEAVTKVMALAVAEPEAVARFTAWVVAAHETVLELMVKLLQSLRRSQKSWRRVARHGRAPYSCVACVANFSLSSVGAETSSKREHYFSSRKMCTKLAGPREACKAARALICHDDLRRRGIREAVQVGACGRICPQPVDKKNEQDCILWRSDNAKIASLRSYVDTTISIRSSYEKTRNMRTFRETPTDGPNVRAKAKDRKRVRGWSNSESLKTRFLAHNVRNTQYNDSTEVDHTNAMQTKYAIQRGDECELNLMHSQCSGPISTRMTWNVTNDAAEEWNFSLHFWSSRLWLHCSYALISASSAMASGLATSATRIL